LEGCFLRLTSLLVAYNNPALRALNASIFQILPWFTTSIAKFKPMKVIIVEDEALYADRLEMLIEKLEYELIGIVDNSTEALQLIESNPPDFILMDIYIRGQYDGIELATRIHQQYDIPIIFITSLLDDLTFQRAARANPIHFITKPFSDLQLQRSIELSIRSLAKLKEEPWENDVVFKDHLFIKVRQKLEKIATADILFIEADGRYCQIITEDKKFLVRLSLQELSGMLSGTAFIPVHRSYLLNASKLKNIDLQDSFIQVNQHQIPLSKRHRELLLKKLKWI
jgi:DNA-binding LytR/AlgR family response regulator